MRGSPDYGQAGFPVALPDLSNDSVLSAILNFAPMDTRGRLLVLDNFRDGMNMWGLGSGGGGANPKLEISALHSYASQIGVVLAPGAIAGFSRMNRNIYLVSPAKMGLECAFWTSAFSGSFEQVIIWNSPTLGLITGGIRYRVETGLFYIYSGAAWVQTNLVSLTAGLGAAWMVLKIVINMDTGKYDHMVFGHQRYDFVNNEGASIGGIAQPYNCTVQVRVEGQNGFTSEVYLGYVILTRDEP